MGETVLVPGGRDVRGTLDVANRGGTTGDGDAKEQTKNADSVVVACPPHPEHGGHRGDPRLVAVSDALGERGIDCLRIDYGPWDEGYGERADARNAVEWATGRYDRVGLFGYSFGGAVAALAAADLTGGDTNRADGGEMGRDDDGDETATRGLAALSSLAPAARLAGGDLDAVAALDVLSIPVQVVYGVRDDTVDWESVVERTRERGGQVVEMSADHFFVGQETKVARTVADFLAGHLG